MPPSACLRPRLLFLIDPLAQFLAGFEMRNEFLRYVDPLARFRIAADARRPMIQPETPEPDRKSTRLNSSHITISYAVFCLKKKNSSCSFASTISTRP